MKEIHQHKPVANIINKNILEYLPPNTVILDLPFILTPDKTLTVGMPYMKLEGLHKDAIKLLDVWDEDNVVYLKIQNIQTGKINTISWILDYSGGYWLWSLASLDYLMNLTNIS